MPARFVLFAISVGLIVSGVSWGQDFPSKPIRITAANVGGSSDFAARLIAQPMAESLGRQVIVDNRPGGLLAIETVAKAAPDGYTLLIENTGFWVGPMLRKLSYDAIKDFSPISLTNRQPNLLVVHPSMPVKSVKELIALAKAKPGELNYMSAGIGTSAHLASELFASMAGVKLVHVPYKGTAPGLTDMVGGQIQLAFPNIAAATPFVKSGRLRALAITTAEPSALTPGLPTVAASGVPGYEAVAIQGLFAPAKTPAAIISRLSQEIVRAVNRPDVKEKFNSSGSDIVGSTPEQFAAAIAADITRLEKVIKDAGIKVE
jgi:tripartite-type tricarboxylate transporter receptor subunit TctC